MHIKMLRKTYFVWMKWCSYFSCLFLTHPPLYELLDKTGRIVKFVGIVQEQVHFLHVLVLPASFFVFQRKIIFCFFMSSCFIPKILLFRWAYIHIFFTANKTEKPHPETKAWKAWWLRGRLALSTAIEKRQKKIFFWTTAHRNNNRNISTLTVTQRQNNNFFYIRKWRRKWERKEEKKRGKNLHCKLEPVFTSSSSPRLFFIILYFFLIFFSFSCWFFFLSISISIFPCIHVYPAVAASFHILGKNILLFSLLLFIHTKHDDNGY